MHNVRSLLQHLPRLTELLPEMEPGETLFDFYPDEAAMDWEPWAHRSWLSVVSCLLFALSFVALLYFVLCFPRASLLRH
jgi:hypothetical protein